MDFVDENNLEKNQKEIKTWRFDMCGFQVKKAWLSNKSLDISRTSFLSHEAPDFVVECRIFINI